MESYKVEPIEEKMFTITDIQRVCGASPNIIRSIAEKAGVESFISKGNRHSIVFDFNSARQIIAIYKNYSRVDEIAKRNRSEPKTIEELRAEHPLVTDDRFFKLSFFPDVVPNCFKECEL